MGCKLAVKLIVNPKYERTHFMELESAFPCLLNTGKPGFELLHLVHM
jgi:hypothetical protein